MQLHRSISDGAKSFAEGCILRRRGHRPHKGHPTLAHIVTPTVNPRFAKGRRPDGVDEDWMDGGGRTAGPSRTLIRSPRRQWGKGQSRDAPALSGSGGDPRPIAVPNMPGDGPHDDDAADEAGDGGHLTETDPNPCNGERRFQRVDQCVLGSRDHLTTHGEKDQPEAELGGPEQEQLQHVRR